MHKLTAGVLSSQISEDCFNFMKNSKQLKGKKKFRRVQKCMSSALTAKVLSGKHRYKELKVDQAATFGKSRPPDDAFTPHKGKHSMEFHKLVSTSQSTEHYSPGAENWCVRFADLACLRVARARHDFQLLSRVWLGTFARHSHHVVWKKANSESWYFPVMHFKDSAVMMAPAHFETVRRFGKTHWCWYPSGALPSLKPVDNLDDYQASSSSSSSSSNISSSSVVMLLQVLSDVFVGNVLYVLVVCFLLYFGIQHEFVAVCFILCS